jgi:hypothetical protein
MSGVDPRGDHGQDDRAWDELARGESPAERADRNLGELLQELRVLAVGVQVLLGFLLSFPLNARFSTLGHGQRVLYTASVLSATVATICLIGPVAYHRLVFKRHQKARLVQASNAMALAGIAGVGIAVTAALWLTMSIVYSPTLSLLFGLGAAALIVALWIVLPLTGRRTGS